MGILDSIVKTYTPVGKVTEALDNAGKTPAPAPTPASPPPAEAKTPQQAAYEAKEKYMNRNNPGFVPRAKGGCVKAGGHPMKNVDYKVKKESF